MCPGNQQSSGSKRIMIIDDEPCITDVIALFARKLGYLADVSSSADATLDKIKETDYWAVFCDLKMPGLNGLEMFERVCQMRSELSKRFVLLTGAIPDKLTESAVREKNIILLRKPFNFEEFTRLFSSLERQV